MNLFRTKPLISELPTGVTLHRCLNAFDLTLLGMGAIIGAGIFVLTGIAAATYAGPAVITSFLLAGLACTFSSLSYAELAASIGGCGSAYGYAYAGIGEFVAWLIGWDLLLEYGVSCAAVAIGWSGYINDELKAIGWFLPDYLLKAPYEGGIVNLPAVFIILCLSVLLTIGVRESARFNALMVFIKLMAITVFIIIAVQHVQPVHWHPFMPFGWHGVVAGAALVFFAYIGFDAVSTAAEETVNPQRNLPIGIIASLIICTVIYMLVAALLTGVISYKELNVSSPVAYALLQLGYRFGAGVVAAGAIAGLTTVILVMYYGFTRVFLAMSRDGLLPGFFSKIHPITRTPARLILGSGVVIAVIAGFIPIHLVVELVNIGTLAAFSLVCGGVIVMRHIRPNLPRSFRVPFSPWVPSLGIISCVYLMMYLSSETWLRLFIWMVVGLVIYFCYSHSHSKVT